jgi:hypothetical protein
MVRISNLKWLHLKQLGVGAMKLNERWIEWTPVGPTAQLRPSSHFKAKSTREIDRQLLSTMTMNRPRIRECATSNPSLSAAFLMDARSQE